MRARAGSRIAYLRRGEYFLDAPLRFLAADSGERIVAYPDEHPVLYGGLPVTSWRPTQDGHVAAALSPAPDGGLPIIVADARAVPNARMPLPDIAQDHEQAWLFADSLPDGIDPHRNFRVRGSDAALLAAIPPGAVVTIFGHRGWQDYVLPIQHIDVARRIVTLDGSAWDALGEGSRYALLNTLPTARTWRFDPHARLLEMPALDQSPRRIVAGSLACLLSLEGTQDVTIAGMRLVGSGTEGAAVCLRDTRRVRLDRLDIAMVGDGIRLTAATATTITASEIAHTGGFGVVLRHHSDATTVQSNWLHDIGWLHQDASAIWFEGSSHGRFMRNRIETVAKFAIGGGALGDQGAYDNIIDGNDIDRANQRTSDGGGIMVINWAQDNTRDVIRNNLVTRTSALGNIGWDLRPHVSFQDPATRLVSDAIYLDDWASDVKVAGNLLCDNIGGIALHAGWDNLVTGNLLLANRGIAINIDSVEWLGDGAHPHAMEHNAVSRNAVFLDQPGTGQSGIVAIRGGDGVARFARNVYAGPGLNDSAFHQEPHALLAPYSFGIDSWRARGQDIDAEVGTTTASAVLRDGAVRVVGPADPPPPVLLEAIGRPQDREILAERVRQRCGL